MPLLRRRSSSAPIDDALTGYQQVIVETPWFSDQDVLGDLLEKWVEPHLNAEDIVCVAEKAAIVTTTGTIRAADISPGRLARQLARLVRPRPGSLGLAIPEKMQWLVDEVGVVRVSLAVVLAGLSRPFGIRGAFYVVCGTRARAIDGMRPPYEGHLLPPLRPHQADALANKLSRRCGSPVAIVDINDLGGSIRGRSDGCPSSKSLMQALSGNPHGGRSDSTPFVILRNRSIDLRATVKSDRSDVAA